MLISWLCERVRQYWVPYSKVAAIKATIIKHLPVLVFGQSSAKRLEYR